MSWMGSAGVSIQYQYTSFVGIKNNVTPIYFVYLLEYLYKIGLCNVILVLKFYFHSAFHTFILDLAVVSIVSHDANRKIQIRPV